MTVTAGGSDNVSEDVAVDCLLDKDTRTMKILFHKVKFVPQMPISLDVTVPDVGYSEKDSEVTFSGDGIVSLRRHCPVPEVHGDSPFRHLDRKQSVPPSQFR